MDNSPIRVLLISPLPPPRGGVARWTELVTGHLASRSDILLDVLNTAVRLRSPQSRSRLSRVLAGSVEAVWTILRFAVCSLTRRPDVVHINSSGELALIRDFTLAHWANWLGLPVVLHLRFGRVPHIVESQTREWKLLKRVIELASLVVAIDSRSADVLEKSCPDACVTLIPNCVDITEYLSPIERSEVQVVFAGWVVPTKGVEELLEAWSNLRDPDLRLLVLGGCDEQYVAGLRDRGLLDGRTSLRGEVSHEEVLEALRTCAVFVLPSHTEGFPNVVVEAMAAAAPIIATPVGAVPDMLAEGAGVLVPVSDAERLGKALRHLLSEPRAREAIGARARRRAIEHYSVSSVTQRYVALWKSLACR